MALKIDSNKITSLINDGLKAYEKEASIEEIGKVMMAGDGIAIVSGLSKAMAGEMLQFPGGVYGVALNLDKNGIGAIIMGEYTKIQEGDPVKCTGRILEVPVGEELIGRVIDPLGKPLDNKGPIKTKTYRPVEFMAP
ncbi:MAG TPA: F0F1 ATP synthase subunit alpha, partial [Actinobacteria bacterium]|nr:F0F1 ATP synthase subunit alpha [Actinomycetota bacterium]